jgi:hypothetical protein
LFNWYCTNVPYASKVMNFGIAICGLVIENSFSKN